MRVLIACEFSGTVREAFKAVGCDAWSCDLLPTEIPGQHIQGDVLDIIDDGWDLMIAHPPCKYLSYVGMRHWNNPGRDKKRQDALGFFVQLICAKWIPRICIENPLGYPCQAFRVPDQIIHPYYFGDPIQKRTCLWLINLPPLIYRLTDELWGPSTATDKPLPMYISQGEKTKGKKIHWVEGIRGVKDRSHERSRFFPSVAKAMAEQWGRGAGVETREEK